MANSSKSTDAARVMLQNLEAAEALAATLTATAPITMAASGGADQLVAKFGKPTGALFWTLELIPELLWEQMAAEHQARLETSSRPA